MDIFCKIINGELPSNTCFENDYVKCIMDTNPSSPGHVLVIPKKHYETYKEMDSEAIVKVYEAGKIILSKMEKSYPNLAGVKFIVNYGEPQLIKHFHLHLLPVYKDNLLPETSQEEFCEILKSTD